MCSPWWAVSKVSSAAMYRGWYACEHGRCRARRRAVPGCASGAFAAPLRRARVVQAAGLVVGRLFCGRLLGGPCPSGANHRGRSKGRGAVGPSGVCRGQGGCVARVGSFGQFLRERQLPRRKHGRVPRGLCSGTGLLRERWLGVFSTASGSRASAQDSVRCRRWRRWIARRSCTRATTT